MNITKNQLQRLIHEELEAILNEAEKGPPKKQSRPPESARRRRREPPADLPYTWPPSLPAWRAEDPARSRKRRADQFELAPGVEKRKEDKWSETYGTSSLPQVQEEGAVWGTSENENKKDRKKAEEEAAAEEEKKKQLESFIHEELDNMFMKF